LHAQWQYLVNIKDIDLAVRSALPAVHQLATTATPPATAVLRVLCDALQRRWPQWLAGVELGLSPFLSISSVPWEHPMMRLSQKFEFAAAHRLHNPQLGDEENRRLFGKCNNALGHGHNYELQVTVRAAGGERALPIDLSALERVVDETVIRRFDHKHLNLETTEFAEVIPSVENIARVIYGLLRPQVEMLDGAPALAAVTVWETSKTWCEYSE
jgi:6-pyruvoyltetrahydropterin/6-carboxytetrahydropterin synthase